MDDNNNSNDDDDDDDQEEIDRLIGLRNLAHDNSPS